MKHITLRKDELLKKEKSKSNKKKFSKRNQLNKYSEIKYAVVEIIKDSQKQKGKTRTTLKFLTPILRKFFGRPFR